MQIKDLKIGAAYKILMKENKINWWAFVAESTGKSYSIKEDTIFILLNLEKNLDKDLSYIMSVYLDGKVLSTLLCEVDCRLLEEIVMDQEI